MTIEKFALRKNWGDKAAIGMAVLFTVVIYALILRQYASFNTRAADLDRFNQALWNTLHGRFMYSTIEDRSVLGGHFSPLMIALSPFLLIWNDPRIFPLVKTIGLAVSGLFLYKIIRDKHPGLAPWFLLTYYLNPAMSEIALLELRRLPLAMPFLAMALYALYHKNRRLLFVSLFIALLAKEDVALIVVMFGVYLLLIERDWRWGGSLIILGVAWVALVLLVTNPYFDPKKLARADNSVDAYRGLYYFVMWGNSLPEIIKNILQQPGLALARMFDAEGQQALWRVFMPLGFVLPLLAPTWFFMAVPTIGYMMLSSQPTMHRLEDWYLAGVLPILFSAIAVGLGKRPYRQAKWLTAVLLIATLIGYTQFSYLPLGKKFRPHMYTIAEHDRLAHEILTAVPGDAQLVTQSAYSPLLAFRKIIDIHPWLPDDLNAVEYYLFDRQAHFYPLGEIERNDAINNLLADPTKIVEIEADGIFLIRNNGAPLPSFNIDQTAEDAIRLDRVDVAPVDERGFYQNTTETPIIIHPGQTIRVTLYWEAVAAPEAERTVSVRVAAPDGWLLAQQDMKPSNGARPTSWWQPGWQLRDIYYLTIDPGATPGSATLDILLYDSFSLEPVSFNEDAIVTVAPLSITP